MVTSSLDSHQATARGPPRPPPSLTNTHTSLLQLQRSTSFH